MRVASSTRRSPSMTYYAIDDLAERWAVARRTASESVRRHDFPAPLALSGRTRRWPVGEVQAWEAEQRDRVKTRRLPRPAGRKALLVPIVVRRAS